MSKKSKQQKLPAKSIAAPILVSGNSRRNVLLGILLLALAFVVYLPAMNGTFLWDDAVMVRGNQLVTDEMSLKTIWFKTDFPLSLIFLWVEWLLFHGNTVGYHVINALLHGCAAILFWQALRVLGIRGAWLAGAIFAV